MTLPEPAGRYGVVHTGTLLGWVICKATKSWADHAFVLTGEGTVIEATPYDVREAPLSEYAGRQVQANTAEPMTDAQRAAVAETARSYLGREYNWADLGVIGLAELGLHWQILIRLMGGSKALICSQLVALCGKAAGLDWCGVKADPSQVTPADLARRAGMRPYKP